MLITSCYAPALTKKEKEHVYTHVTSLDKIGLKQKVTQFVAENFNSAKSVIQTTENDMIIGDGIIELSSNMFGVTYKMNMGFLIKFEAGQYKLKTVCKSINMHSKGLPSSVPASAWGMHKEDIREQFDAFNQRLSSYIKSESDF